MKTAELWSNLLFLNMNFAFNGWWPKTGSSSSQTFQKSFYSLHHHSKKLPALAWISHFKVKSQGPKDWSTEVGDLLRRVTCLYILIIIHYTWTHSKLLTMDFGKMENTFCYWWSYNFLKDFRHVISYKN